MSCAILRADLEERNRQLDTTRHPQAAEVQRRALGPARGTANPMITSLRQLWLKLRSWDIVLSERSRLPGYELILILDFSLKLVDPFQQPLLFKLQKEDLLL